MPQDLTPSGGITVSIPSLGDNADIVTAFTNYHANVSSNIVAKANIITPTFTTSIQVGTGALATDNVVNVKGQAQSAIYGARYSTAGTGTTYNANTGPTTPVRIFVSKGSPNAVTANLTVGDIWISWT